MAERLADLNSVGLEASFSPNIAILKCEPKSAGAPGNITLEKQSRSQQSIMGQKVTLLTTRKM